jgi:hypothetical protein
MLFAYEIPDFFFSLLVIYHTCRGFVKMCDDFIKVYIDICNSVLNAKYWITYLLRTRWLCALPVCTAIIITTDLNIAPSNRPLHYSEAYKNRNGWRNDN